MDLDVEMDMILNSKVYMIVEMDMILNSKVYMID